MSVDAEGKIIVTGEDSSNHGLILSARLNANGSVDTHFGSGGNVSTLAGSLAGGKDVAVRDGRIIVAGWARGPNGYDQIALLKYLQYNPVTSLAIAGPAVVQAGQQQSYTITTQDAFAELVGDYAGRVHFTSSDPQATLPADYSFTQADHGRYPFGGIVLRTLGQQTLTVTDTVNGVILGTFTILVDVPSITVTTTANSGAGSLRQAILDANGTVGDPGDHPLRHRLRRPDDHPASALPTITDPVIIDGTIAARLRGHADHRTLGRQRNRNCRRTDNHIGRQHDQGIGHQPLQRKRHPHHGLLGDGERHRRQLRRHGCDRHAGPRQFPGRCPDLGRRVEQHHRWLQ